MANVKRVLSLTLILALLVGSSVPFLVRVTLAEDGKFESFGPELAEQLAEIYQQKQALTPAQRKIDSNIMKVVREVEEMVLSQMLSV